MRLLEQLNQIVVETKILVKMIGTEFKRLLRETKSRSDEIDEKKRLSDEKRKKAKVLEEQRKKKEIEEAGLRQAALIEEQARLNRELLFQEENRRM